MLDVERCAPFLRWAGGKRWFCHKIDKYLPVDFTDYYEPFLGGGSIFFYLRRNELLNGDIYLSDFNKDLITAYKCVQNNYEALYSDLCKFKYTENEYYEIRSRYNYGICSEYEHGLYFVYLNLTGFNGIYRVSARDGKYNVPYGHKKRDLEPYLNILKNDSVALKNVSLKTQSFECLSDSEVMFKPKSLFFIDPPYTVSHNNNGFIEYNQKIFDIRSQESLRYLLDKIDMDGGYFIMTNARHEAIRNIFDGYYFHDESRASLIGGKYARRGVFEEYIVTNFAVEEEAVLWH